MAAPDRPVADSLARSWVERAPGRLRPYLRLARYDRPIGFWLLAIPCWAGVGLAALDGQWGLGALLLAPLLGLGAVAMRGAGCTYNDILDRDLDAKVARTADRPLAAGVIGLRAAWAFLAVQCLVGLGVLLALPRAAQLTALAALPLVILYPLMKRITWWPQAWLGLTFNWGALVGFAAATGALAPQAGLLYAGLAFWTLGYDTIYACQDKEDDALVGVKSTARLFGDKVRAGVAAAYLAAALLVLAALALAALDQAGRAGPPEPLAAAAGVLTGWLLFACLLLRQTIAWRPEDAASSLAWFKANREAGLGLVLGMGLAPVAARSLLAVL